MKRFSAYLFLLFVSSVGLCADVNAKDARNKTPLSYAKGEIANLLRKHGGKTGEELKSEGK